MAAASPLALHSGVRIGMPLSEAKSLLQRAGQHPPDSFFILEHDPQADLATLHQLADSLSPFSPLVGVEQMEPASNQPFANSILLDITGLDRLFGNEKQLAAELLQFVESGDYLPRLAIANTLGTAWGASRFGAASLRRKALGPPSEPSSNFSPHKTTALPPANTRPQSDRDNCLIIAPDDPETFLHLPIESLRLPSPVIELLHQLGIRTNEQLWQLPRAELAMRFGDIIHRRMDQATGKLAEPILARPATIEFTAGQVLEYPTHHRETIEVILARLIEQICQQLRRRQQGGMQWLITLMLVDEPAIRLTLNLFQASATASEIISLAAMQLEQYLIPKRFQPSQEFSRKNASENSPAVNGRTVTSLPAKRHSARGHLQVQEIRVAVTAAVLLVPHQRMLFDESSQLNRQALTQLINQLTSRLGPQHVVYPQLVSGAQPEFSFRYRPLVDIHRQRRSVGKLAPQSHVVGRPLRIFNPPIEIQMSVEKYPEIVSAEQSLPFPAPHQCRSLRIKIRLPPAGLDKPQKEWAVTQAVGPERIETGWWRGALICRDYWRVETSAGPSLWIYCDLHQKKWFLQGEF